jgi:hypothetical protein
MNAQEAFIYFIKKALSSGKAERLTELAGTRKGQQKILNALCHQFKGAIREGVTRRNNYEALWDRQCYVFHETIGFGMEFPTIRDAYDKLSLLDSWLILLGDGSAGIYRPEAKWDSESLILS